MDAGVDAGEVDAGLDGGTWDGGAEDGGLEDAGVADAGYCVTDAGDPPNLLFNPGFECGVPPDGWSVIGNAQLGVVSALARNGAQSARMVSLDGGVMSLYPATPPVTGGPGIKTFCASSWVNGTPGSTVRISVQVYPLGGGVQDTSFSAPLSGGWERIAVSARTTLTDDQVTLRVWMPDAKKGEALLVDDAELWVSDGGKCAER
ncbi:MAG: hypothetical protein IRZ16_22085 [Myxococcaceae bacterium]|nr:hypothetical protein [Myxococcaceae bacterium]